MTLVQMEAEFRELATQVSQMRDEQKTRETHWQKAGQQAKFLAIMLPLAGLGLMLWVAFRPYPVSDQSHLLWSQFVLMGIVFMLLGQALHPGKNLSFVLKFPWRASGKLPN